MTGPVQMNLFCPYIVLLLGDIAKGDIASVRELAKIIRTFLIKLERNLGNVRKIYKKNVGDFRREDGKKLPAMRQKFRAPNTGYV